MDGSTARSRLQEIDAQREVFRLLGISIPERQARDVLADIHEYKWLEAEQAGFDVWSVIQPDAPLRAAAVHWARRYLPEYSGRSRELEQVRPEGEMEEQVYPSALWLLGRLIRRTVRQARAERLGAARQNAPAIPTEAESAGEPAWRASLADLPDSLYASARTVRDGKGPWLYLPCQAIGEEAYNEFALRQKGSGLQVVAAVPVNGVRVFNLSPASCSGVEFLNVLLLSQVTFLLKDGTRLALRYHALGDAKVRGLISGFLAALFAPARIASGGRGALEEVPARAFGPVARLRTLLLPGETLLSVAEQERASIETTGSLFRKRERTVPAGALAVTNRRVVLLTGTHDGRSTPHGYTVTMVPLRDVKSVGTTPAGNGTTAVVVRADGAAPLRIEFRDKLTGGLEETLTAIREIPAALG